MSKSLLEAAKLLKDHCENGSCSSCFFNLDPDVRGQCIFIEKVPAVWKIELITK